MGRTNIGRRVMRFSKIRFSATQLSNRNKVEFETTVDGGNGKFVVEVERDFAPQGSDRFFSLVENGFYNEAGFFRVVPNFVVQFGLAADPAMTEKWKKVIPDDPKNREIGNKRGTISLQLQERTHVLPNCLSIWEITISWIILVSLQLE